MRLQQRREVPDLLDLFIQLQDRISSLETGRRLGNSSVDNNELIVRNGDFTVRNTNNNRTLQLQHGNVPNIQFFPNDIEPPPNRATIFSWNPGDAAALELNVNRVDSVTHIGVQDGGKVLLTKGGSYFSHQPEVGAESYVSFGVVAPETIRFKGKWSKTQVDATDACVFGQDSFGAGFGGASYGFGTAFSTLPIILYSLVSAGTAVAHDLASADNTGFTVSWATGTTAKTISWMAFRV
jgi:hypothetical protein